MALFLCFLALLGSLYLRLDPDSWLHAAGNGAIAGLMVMLRFDAMPAALVALIAAPLLGLRGRRLALMVLVFSIVISPWVVYSWSHFHTPFATDNRSVALAIHPDAYVLDYHSAPKPTLGDQPVAWLTKLLIHLPIVGASLADAIVRSVFLLPLFVIAGALYARQRGGERGSPATVFARLRSRPVLALVAVVLAPMAAYLVTGYQESRYFSPFIWLAELLALGTALALSTAVSRRVIVVVACIAGVGKSIALARYVPAANPLAAMRAQLSRSDVDGAVGCLRRVGAAPGAGVLFLTNVGLLNAYRFGAMTGWRASPIPRNWMALTPAERESFVRRFHLTFVMDTLPAGPARLATAPLDGCAEPLRRLSLGPGAG